MAYISCSVCRGTGIDRGNATSFDRFSVGKESIELCKACDGTGEVYDYSIRERTDLTGIAQIVVVLFIILVVAGKLLHYF
ncbi:MAG: hypothetical protein COU81_03255 [Candidatus Portnoybacteria bacterium CG10_big_fil_rev_8_21_14_0_10_36_7]|uniref:Uncharacterized protein n=1 Tax=Candidatus Portnoybacteria bacterium CG10_big_fil_rev_8_21_14_0_10_36_7 TaxID=1974812 RepID=A0A2M8KDI6_9BACT|nr:MAG: hypothetical protein COU81_03255 [Candidatus Portnoybacteria bacterium CG10_big_fil_rev_8_21_14_0_10_36_7]